MMGLPAAVKAAQAMLDPAIHVAGLKVALRALVAVCLLGSPAMAGKHSQSTHSTPKGYHHDGSICFEDHPEELVFGLILLVGIGIVVLVQSGGSSSSHSIRTSYRASPRRPTKSDTSFSVDSLIPVPLPISHWETLYLDPSDVPARLSLQQAIASELDRLLGPKKIERPIGPGAIVLRRSRLQYESRVETHVGSDRHGFILTVPSHGFQLRITCPRHVPSDVVGAPWDDLLENLCKIDRTVIKSRKSKSQPLTYTPKHGRHPCLRVEILSRGHNQEPSALPA